VSYALGRPGRAINFSKGDRIMAMKVVGLFSFAVSLGLFFISATNKIDVLLPTTLFVGAVWCVYQSAHKTALQRVYS